MITTTTIFIYRRRMPAEERPFRSWGYPMLPALFIVAAAVLLYYSFAGNFRSSLVGTAIILGGLPFHLCHARSQPPTPAGWGTPGDCTRRAT